MPISSPARRTSLRPRSPADSRSFPSAPVCLAAAGVQEAPRHRGAAASATRGPSPTLPQGPQIFPRLSHSELHGSAADLLKKSPPRCFAQGRALALGVAPRGPRLHPAPPLFLHHSASTSGSRCQNPAIQGHSLRHRNTGLPVKPKLSRDLAATREKTAEVITTKPINPIKTHTHTQRDTHTHTHPRAHTDTQTHKTPSHVHVRGTVAHLRRCSSAWISSDCEVAGDLGGPQTEAVRFKTRKLVLIRCVYIIRVLRYL